MNARRLAELLAEFALEHPDRPISEVTAVEFIEWYGRKYNQ